MAGEVPRRAAAQCRQRRILPRKGPIIEEEVREALELLAAAGASVVARTIDGSFATKGLAPKVA